MIETMSMMSFGQKSRFLTLGPCSSKGSSSLFWVRVKLRLKPVGATAHVTVSQGVRLTASAGWYCLLYSSWLLLKM